jgi:DNA-binding GntR family transcriptional regulator
VLQERRLAEELGVSRTPLREALSRLEGQGFVARTHRVVMVKQVTITEYIQAVQLRILLEGEAAAQAAGKLAAEELASLRGQIQALMTDGRPPAAVHWTVDDAFHDGIAAAGGNDLMASIIRNLRHKTRIFDLNRMPDRFLPGCREHLAILDALETGSRDAARAAMVGHLENVKTSIIRKLAES